MKSIADIRGQNARAREGGWALVSVLWVMTALALLAAATEMLTNTTYRMERRALERDRIAMALDAGVVRAVLGIEAPDLSDRWRVDGVPQPFAFDGMNLTVAVQDELGRFDLNAIDGSILSALFKAEHVPQDQADTLTDRILDWRGPPSPFHRLHGATNANYTAAGLHYFPRHGPFQSVDELRLVLGMTPDIFDKIRPALTVYTKRPMIDPRYGTKDALLAMYAGDANAVDSILKARTAGTEMADPSLSLAGRTYSITVNAGVQGRNYQRYAVVMLTGDPKRPYLTLFWR